jgi:hypothetical protein
MSARLVQTARIARIAALTIGCLAAAGCGPPEVGSVKLPEGMSRAGKPGFGPGAIEAGTGSLGPGDFRPAQAPKKRASRR